MTREILTLQIGHESNEVGVDLWNQLDVEFSQNNPSIDYNSYFTFDGKNNLPSPRVLMIDYRNTFGNLLDEHEEKYQTKNSSVEVVDRPMNDQFWSKKLKTKAKFHPKSLIPLRDYWYTPNNEENQFDIYPIGEQVFKKSFDPIENSLHFLLESCDSLQSFRCLYDVNNSFAGLFTSIQDYLHDECPKQPIWSFGIGAPTSLLNLSLALIHSLNDNQMPTIFPSANPHLGLAIQHSLFSSLIPLDLLADRLCPMKKHFLNLCSEIPLELNRQTFYHYLEKSDLFPSMNPIACHYFIRGIEQDQLYNQSVYHFNIQSSSELFATYLREQFGSTLFVSTDSWIDKYDRMNLLAGLVNDESYAVNYIDDLLRELKKINWKVLSKRWQENDYDEQIFEQLMNDLNFLHEQYQ